MAILCLGVFVIAAAMIRVIDLTATLYAADTTWDFYYFAVWTALEVNIGLICASAPAIRPLLLKFFPHLMASLSGPSSGTALGYGSRTRKNVGTTEDIILTEFTNPKLPESCGTTSTRTRNDDYVHAGTDARHWSDALMGKRDWDSESQERVLQGKSREIG